MRVAGPEPAAAGFVDTPAAAPRPPVSSSKDALEPARPSAAAPSRPAATNAPQAPSPHPVAAGVLKSALAKMTGAGDDLQLLALEHEANQIEAAGGRSLIRTKGAKLAIHHKERQVQLQKAMDAAKSKSWWQKLLGVFKYVAIAASACTGITGAIAAGLMVAATLIEKKYPKLALVLRCAGGAVTMGAGMAAFFGAAKAASTAGQLVQVGAKLTGAGASAGGAVATGMQAKYQHDEARADASSLAAQSLIEQQKGAQRDELDLLKQLNDRDLRATRTFLSIIERRAQVATAALRA
jgi:hypothetical protein